MGIPMGNVVNQERHEIASAGTCGQTGTRGEGYEGCNATPGGGAEDHGGVRCDPHERIEGAEDRIGGTVGPVAEETTGLYPKQPYGHLPDEDAESRAGCHEMPSGKHNHDLGKRGEDATVSFLKRKGFNILERNWRCIAGEADIIAERYGACHEIHFIEVKTRSSTCSGFPEEAVTEQKRRRYERIAEIYLRGYEDEAIVTFDIVSILVTRPGRAFLRMHMNVLSGDLG